MSGQWHPLLEVTLDHTAYLRPPFNFVPSVETRQIMAAMELRMVPNRPSNILDLYGVSGVSGLEPILKAPTDTVLTFLIEPTSPRVEMMTALPEPALVRCFANDQLAQDDDVLSLMPAIGMGRPARSVSLEMPVGEITDRIELRRICTGVTADTFIPNNGMLHADLSHYACGC